MSAEPGPPEPVIQAEGVCQSFGKKQVVREVSLRVRAGEIFGLVGPDGAGKTTTVRLIAGSMRPSAGEIRVAGFDMRRAPERARAHIGYVSQRFSMYEDLTVLENIRFFAEVRGIPRAMWRKRCDEVLDFVGLSPFGHRRAGALSGGMKQKLGLAVALAHRPRALLLDEPTTGVDPVTRQDFWQLVIRLVAEEGVAALVTTPYMDEASRCTRVGFMREGRLMLEGSPAELRARLAGRVIEILGAPMALLRHTAAAFPGVASVQPFGGRLHARLSVPATEAVLSALREALLEAGAEVSGLRAMAPNLEDVFIDLAGAAA